MHSRQRVDELTGDAHAVTGLTHAALEDATDAELTAD
jgi:hypothetical protein